VTGSTADIQRLIIWSVETSSEVAVILSCKISHMRWGVRMSFHAIQAQHDNTSSALLNMAQGASNVRAFVQIRCLSISTTSGSERNNSGCLTDYD
jgi:hypothetical protein